MGSAEWWVGHAGCLYQKHDARWSPIGNDDSQKAPRSFPFEQKRPCHSAKPHKSKGTLWDRCATHQSTTTTAVHALPDCFILTTSHETIYPHEDPYLIPHSTFLAIKQVAGWVALRHWCFVTYIQQPTNLSQMTGKAQQRYVTNLSHKRVNTWFCDVCRGG